MLALSWAGALPAAVPALAAPTRLLCEYLENPVGIDELKPRLGWICTASDAKARGLRQTAYQILVASSPALLAKDRGDVWDSGRVVSGRSLQIPYDGAGLLSHQPCYWKVRVWDQDGSVSPWSAPATWSMGFLKPQAWTAQWIGRDDGKPVEKQSALTQASWIWFPDPNVHEVPVEKRWFRKTFVLPPGAKIAAAQAVMTADDKFELFVNGQSVLKGDKFNVVYEADVSSRLHAGKNLLAVEVENGVVGPAALIGALEVSLSDGRTMTIPTDATWMSVDRITEKWNQSDFGTTGWKPAKVVGAYGDGPWGSIVPGKAYLPATYLRKDFAVAHAPKRAVLYVTCLGNVEPRLNGRKVGDDYFTPGWTDYHKRLYYRAYDVTSQVKVGANTLGAVLGDGWFRGNLSIIGQNIYGKKTRLRAELHIFNSDGTSQVVATDTSWKAEFGPIVEADIQAGETYDARREMPGWDLPGYKTSANWTSVQTGAEVAPELQAYPGTPVRRLEEFPPVKITSLKPNLQVFDMGKNFSGWARLRVTAPAGTKIIMRFGEMLNPDGSVYRTNLRSARVTDTYICKGGGEEVWEPEFTYHGFQYAEVEGLPAPATSKTLTGVVVHSALPRLGAFISSSEIANRTSVNMRWSIRSNSFDIPTDCPQRDERMGWMDYHEVARSSQYELDQSSLLTKWVTDMVDARLPDGGFSQISPDVHHFGWSPGWADSSVLIPWTLYRVQGDTRLAERWFKELASHVAYYQERSPDGIAPDVGYGDWLAPDLSTPKNLISTALYARCAFAMSEMSGALGRSADAKRYRDLFQKIRTAFQKKFVLSNGTIGTNSQGSYVMPLAFDLLDEPQRGLAAKHLVEAIEAKGNHLSTGMVTTHLLLPALTKIGRTDVAYRLLEQKTFPSWGYFLDRGATSIWERWDSKTDSFNAAAMNSYNHANLGTCTEWFYRTVLGIDFLEPGFGKILIHPEPGVGMTWAKGHYDSPHGRIATDWSAGAGKFRLDVTIPPNTSAEVFIPAASARKVNEGGQPVLAAKGVSFLRQEGGNAVFAVGSGNYHFESAP